MELSDYLRGEYEEYIQTCGRCNRIVMNVSQLRLLAREADNRAWHVPRTTAKPTTTRIA